MKNKKMAINITRENAKDWYLAKFNSFENNLNGSKEMPFHQIRKLAISRFSTLGFPAMKDEEWKYTNVEPILKKQFNLSEKREVQASVLNKLTFAGLKES